MLVSYKWLQNYFKKSLPDPDKLADGLTFHSFEVEGIENQEDDVIFNIDILPNRAHDCLSHFGVAKEVSALFDLDIKEKNFSLNNKNVAKTNLTIDKRDHKCLRYVSRIVRNVNVTESPEWLKERMKSIGQRSINNIVDLANFVMFDIGQPIHCFDLDKLESSNLIIRPAKSGEELTTLDKKNVKLDESVLVIADDKDPLAIAGIKGGTKAEVDSNTKNIVIEVANFDATSIRKTAKKINILTDAVKRYENKISPELCSLAMSEMSSLINDVAGGDPEEVVDIYPEKPEKIEVEISKDYINKVLGSDFSQKEVESVWQKLKFQYKVNGDLFKIEIPTLRLDLRYNYDLVEEVVRILGYDKLEERLPREELDSLKKVSSEQENVFYKILACRQKLLDEGYCEVMTYVFRDKGEIEVLGSASDKNFLRSNLTDGLKESIQLNIINAPLLAMDKIKLFEIGTIFKKNKEEIHVAYGDKKEVIEKTLDQFIKDNDLYIDRNILLKDIKEYNIKKETFIPWSPYPFITRDISVWVEEGTSADELAKVYKDLGTELLVRDPYLFDQFTKPATESGEKGKTSYAFRLVFQSFNRTLTDEEINKIMAQIEDKIASLGWTVR